MTATVHPVDERLPTGKLAALGLQHVLVMYAGAVAVPLIVGRALKLSPEQVAMLISADLFCCGLVTLIQSLGATQWFGIKLPVMMGVTFASVAPMVAMANSNPGVAGAGLIFGSIIGAGVISILIAPIVSRMLRYFPPVVTGTIIAVIGISLMRIGINWIFGNPFGPTAPSIVSPEHAKWLADVGSLANASVTPAAPMAAASAPASGASAAVLTAVPAIPKGLALVGTRAQPEIRAAVAHRHRHAGAGVDPADRQVRQGLRGQHLGAAGHHHRRRRRHGGGPHDLRKSGQGRLVRHGAAVRDRHARVRPDPDPDHDAGDDRGDDRIHRHVPGAGRHDRQEDRPEDADRGLRTDGLGTLIGGIFNTFPYTSFSQNVGLVGVTGVKSRFVCVAGGIILIVLGLLPKMAALVESLPTFVLGGAGLVMFGMVAATGIRILSNVDYKTNRNNLFIVAISIGIGMIPLIAPNFKQWMPHSIHPLIESGILLSSICAVALNLYFNGAQGDGSEAIEAAKQADAH